MGNIIATKDGCGHAAFGVDDLYELVSDYAGTEVSEALQEAEADMFSDAEDLREYCHDLEADAEKQKKHYQKVMKELRQQAEAISRIICKSEIDRKALSEAAGRIGIITGRECR